jgi:hypothetical protein
VLVNADEAMVVVVEKTSLEDVAREDVSSEEVSREDVSSEDVDSEDVAREDVSSEEVSREDVSSEDVDSEDVDNEDADGEDIASDDGLDAALDVVVSPIIMVFGAPLEPRIVLVNANEPFGTSVVIVVAEFAIDETDVETGSCDVVITAELNGLLVVTETDEVSLEASPITRVSGSPLFPMRVLVKAVEPDAIDVVIVDVECVATGEVVDVKGDSVAATVLIKTVSGVVPFPDIVVVTAGEPDGACAVIVMALRLTGLVGTSDKLDGGSATAPMSNVLGSDPFPKIVLVKAALAIVVEVTVTGVRSPTTSVFGAPLTPSNVLLNVELANMVEVTVEGTNSPTSRVFGSPLLPVMVLVKAELTKVVNTTVDGN